VAVDTAVLTVTEVLSVLLVESTDGWRLPGTFLHENETLRNISSFQVVIDAAPAAEIAFT